MRADRLVATLLLLQARGSVTAAEVATELEISERTARRDLDALSVAGIPVYSKQGRGGGWELIGGARTDLTGFRTAEARALLTMAVASGTATPEFSGAIRKLVQALPEPQRVEAEQAMASVMTDATSWGNRSASIVNELRRDEHLEPLQLAILERRIITLRYDTPRTGTSERWAHPLGLVTKQRWWYLLADTAKGQRSFRVDRIQSFDISSDRFEPPDDFDLHAAWEQITQQYIEQSSRVTVEAVIDDQAVGPLRALGVETALGERIDSTHRRATLGASNDRILAAQLAGVMGLIELVDPPVELTDRLGALGNELVQRFGSGH